MNSSDWNLVKQKAENSPSGPNSCRRFGLKNHIKVVKEFEAWNILLNYSNLQKAALWALQKLVCMLKQCKNHNPRIKILASRTYKTLLPFIGHHRLMIGSRAWWRNREVFCHDWSSISAEHLQLLKKRRARPLKLCNLVLQSIISGWKRVWSCFCR